MESNWKKEIDTTVTRVKGEVWQWQGWRTRVERSSLLQEPMRTQPGFSIVSSSLRPVKTHRPTNKIPLTTTGGFPFQQTATYFHSTEQTPDPFVCNVAPCTRAAVSLRTQSFARKSDPWELWSCFKGLTNVWFWRSMPWRRAWVMILLWYSANVHWQLPK